MPTESACKPGSPRPHERHLYDWMVGELVAIADEMSTTDEGCDAQRKLTSSMIAGIAEHVSTTRGSGTFDALDWIKAHRDA
ncbi:hypothetical protein [Mycolicibacterium fortuitum]|uniref:hypothetical protein n=1 Tax=Mycolicibacterium fortuitum TaxID=1766 RepID=UPI0010564DDE|nr:hypothetical protein [Mycolicibacterium fortuitum]